MSRLLHYAFDAALVSVAFSGARRFGGFEFKGESIPDETARSIVQQYIGVGDWVVDYSVVLMGRYPDYFKRR
ncbi:hypothetical protein HK405_006244 [Cladochytrium tenue]|nr:hypothetical protein HK405_006244 [Cladochytrium tenue]